MNEQGLRDRVVLVTGSARRLGRAIAGEVAAKGAEVVIHYRSSEVLAAEAAREITEAGGRAYCLPAELSEPEQASQLVEAILSRSGRIDVLVNNVGNYLVKHINETSPEEWDYMIRTTATTTFHMSRAVLPVMIEQGYGRVVNLADAGADLLQAWPETTPYMIGKTGVLLLTKTLAETHAGYGITVNAVSPGTLEDSIVKPAEGVGVMPSGRYGNYEDVTNAVLFLLKDESSHINGANVKVSGGWQV